MGPKPWRLWFDLELPNSLVKNITSFDGHRESDFSVFNHDCDDLVYELYRARDRKDAGDLIEFLLENEFQGRLSKNRGRHPVT